MIEFDTASLWLNLLTKYKMFENNSLDQIQKKFHENLFVYIFQIL